MNQNLTWLQLILLQMVKLIIELVLVYTYLTATTVITLWWPKVGAPGDLTRHPIVVSLVANGLPAVSFCVAHLATVETATR